MNNPIQNYEWGSKTDLTTLFNFEHKDEPQAEVWMGAHKNGCSTIEVNGENTKLSDHIASNPESILGEKTFNEFGELSFLFKILCAAKALSIQVHPNKKQAEAGFENETYLDSSNPIRNYKDPNHKPELVYALTEYQAMNGFREVSEIITNFSRLDIDELKPLIKVLHITPNGLQTFFEGLNKLHEESKFSAINKLIDYAKKTTEKPFDLILELNEFYPNDIGLFAPLMLNVITLMPGEAMFLNACTPHAYIKGAGLEIMANSDNVLRAGLTPKHIDVDELIKCTEFKSINVDTLLNKSTLKDELEEFLVPVNDFRFGIYTNPSDQEISINSAQILLPLDNTLYLTSESGETLDIEKGFSVFIPAYAKSIILSSKGRVAKAFT
ncbi:mannose-6-phosphate isomerase, class I [Aliivibrio fischeri]|nr:mannose-6-phosphate isomerase, class I [Aliivibrio fischeri]MUL06880.1 mannose-6-phosphate isomerase, class I [Aliivibrio fischeri]